MKTFYKILIAVALLSPSFATAAVVQVVNGGTGLSNLTAGLCLKGNGTSPVTLGTCGSSGSGGGTFSTTTSTVSGQNINYPNNNTDIVTVGGTSTSTAPFWFNPNTLQSQIKYASSTAITASTTYSDQGIFNGGPWVDARTCGAKGDGSTDDSSSINTCITTLGNAGGGLLYIPAKAGRVATTKYEICAGPIFMKPHVYVQVQKGVEIQVCNGYASTTVAFFSNTNGTYFATWDGGNFTEAGTPKKLWTAFNVESQNINGGVFWNTIKNVNIYSPSVCIRSSVIGATSGWLNSNTYRDIVCNAPTNAWTFNDDRTGSFVVDETLFDNTQVQSTIGTESCFGDLKAWNTQIINGFCYDLVTATSTSLSINSASLSTFIEGGYLTSNNFVNNGDRTTIVGDRLWMHYASSTVGSLYQYANGAVIIGTSTTNATQYPLNIIDSVVSLGIGTSKFNSKIAFYTAGQGNHQQDFCQAATTTGQSPNSGNIVCSAREGFFVNVDSDQTSTAGKFAVRSNRTDGGITTTGELFTVVEPGIITFANGSTTVLSASSALCISTDCRTSWPTAGGGSGNVGTSSAETANDIPYWTTTSAGVALLSGGNSGLTYDGTKLTAIYASTTELSVARNAYVGTSGTAGTNYNLYVGTTTTMLQTNTGAGANIGNILGYNKVNSLTPGYVSVVTAALQGNTSSVLTNGNGVCFSTYEGSNISGRTMWADCSQYYNTLSSIGASRVNFIANSSGVLTPWLYVSQDGRTTLGATTTDLSTRAQFTVLNTISSTQDILNLVQPTGLASTTVFAVKSTGFTGIGTSSPHQMLTVNGNAYIAGFVTSTSTTQASTFPYASTTALTASGFGYLGNLIVSGSTTLQSQINAAQASTTALSVGGRTILPTYDKSITWASSTPDTNFKSFNTSTTSRVVWLPTSPIGLSTIGCQVTGGSGTAHVALGTGTASTTLVCTTSYSSAPSTVTWSAGAEVFVAASSTAPNGVQDLVITGAFYNQ